MTSRAIYNAFLERAPPQKRRELLQHLSENERKKVEESPKTYGDPTKGVSSQILFLEKVHPSWLSPYLRNLPEREIKLFLSAFSEPQVSGLKKSLGFSGNLLTLSNPAKKYLLAFVLKQIIEPDLDLLPIECLPDSHLNQLIEFKTIQLNTLIDFLGLHDLAAEMRQIIDTSKLKKITDSLSQDEVNYVKILMQGQEAVAFTRMGLPSWQGDSESLKTLIRQRGLNRLAKALYGQSPSLIWYVVHKLDSDRAMTLKKLCTSLENPSAVKLLIGQVLELLSFMGHHHE